MKIGTGSSCACFRPPLHFPGWEDLAEKDSRVVHGVGKVMQKWDALDELEIYSSIGIDSIDPEEMFHIGMPIMVEGPEIDLLDTYLDYREKNILCGKDVLRVTLLYRDGGDTLNSLALAGWRNTKGCWNGDVLSRFEVLECLAKVADALLIMHKNGIYHCDVKPTNIVVKGGIPRLIDFTMAVKYPFPEKTTNAANLSVNSATPYVFWPAEVFYLGGGSKEEFPKYFEAKLDDLFQRMGHKITKTRDQLRKEMFVTSEYYRGFPLEKILEGIDVYSFGITLMYVASDRKTIKLAEDLSCMDILQRPTMTEARRKLQELIDS